jgi:hypothetical protein
MSSFYNKKLDILPAFPDTKIMKSGSMTSRHHTIATHVRQKVEHGGERLWRVKDFEDMPFTAVAQALSRLTKSGKIERLSKGLYYRARKTTFGQSRPNPAAIRQLARKEHSLYPAGLSAANLLGFSTQNPRHNELATSESSIPRKLIGKDTIVHTKRPHAWLRLSETDAALLDFLRHSGRHSELTPDDTIRRTIELLSEKKRFENLFQVADTEPPRARAILGALGEYIGKNKTTISHLRESLNPLSKFDFGLFAQLPNARHWQAKGNR